MTAHNTASVTPSLTDPPDDEPVTDFRSPEHQAEVATKARERVLAEAREALKVAGARSAGGKRVGT